MTTPTRCLCPLACLLFVALPAAAQTGVAPARPQYAPTPAPPEPSITPKLAAKPRATKPPAVQPVDGKYTLRYKLDAGDTLRYEVDHRASVRSTMEGTTQKALTRSQSLKAWKVTDILPPSKENPEGQIELLHTVEQVRMTNQLPDQAELNYDSKKDKTPPPGFEDAAKAVGVPLSRVRITPWGELVKREELHHQPAADPNAPITVLLPKEPVAIGDSWNEPQDIIVRLTESEGTKAIKTRRHLTLKAVEDGVATIKAEHQVLSPVTPPIEAQLAQRLMTGTIKFDLAQGRILSQEMEVDKRVLGFAGQTSSMHYLMKMTERLATPRRLASQRGKSNK